MFVPLCFVFICPAFDTSSMTHCTPSCCESIVLWHPSRIIVCAHSHPPALCKIIPQSSYFRLWSVPGLHSSYCFPTVPPTVECPISFSIVGRATHIRSVRYFLSRSPPFLSPSISLFLCFCPNFKLSQYRILFFSLHCLLPDERLLSK